MSRNLENRKLKLRTLLKEKWPMTAMQIKECTRWHRSNVYRHLDHLIDCGTVKRVNGRGGYLFEVVR